MRNIPTAGTPAHTEPAPILAAIERRIASLELARADAAKLRDVTPAHVPAKHFYEGRVQAFDVALSELRKLAGEVQS